MALNGLIPPSLPHGATHDPGGNDLVYDDFGNTGAGVVETLLRDFGTTALLTMTAGSLSATYFTARQSILMNQLFVILGAVFSVANYVEFALYTVAADSALTMVRRTGDLTATSLTMQSAVGGTTTTNTGFTTVGIYDIPMNKDQAGSAASNYAMVRGTRYALGVVGNAGTTVGKFLGNAGTTGSGQAFFSTATFNGVQPFANVMAKQFANAYTAGSPIPTSHLGSAGTSAVNRFYGAFTA